MQFLLLTGSKLQYSTVKHIKKYVLYNKIWTELKNNSKDLKSDMRNARLKLKKVKEKLKNLMKISSKKQTKLKF